MISLESRDQLDDAVSELFVDDWNLTNAYQDSLAAYRQVLERTAARPLMPAEVENTIEDDDRSSLTSSRGTQAENADADKSNVRKYSFDHQLQYGPFYSRKPSMPESSHATLLHFAANARW